VPSPRDTWHSVAATERTCRYKITSHLRQLPALFEEKEQLNEERARAFTDFQQNASARVPNQAQSGVHDWTDRRCADWLKYDVDLPEHVPLFMGAGIDGGKLLRLDEPKLKALGIDDIDGEIILARLELLARAYRRSQRASLSTSAVLYEPTAGGRT
jgi:hypothetical protein